MFFAAATHASRSVTQVHEKELTMKNTYSQPSQLPFAHYDQDSSSWKTSQDTLLWGSEKFSAQWPRSGMTVNGTAYPLQPLAPRTSETEFSSLLWTPTATANYASPYFADRKGKSGYRNPTWVEWLMGFPIGWTDLAD
jgi:hypothetical protein